MVKTPIHRFRSPDGKTISSPINLRRKRPGLYDEFLCPLIIRATTETDSLVEISFEPALRPNITGAIHWSVRITSISGSMIAISERTTKAKPRKRFIHMNLGNNSITFTRDERPPNTDAALRREVIQDILTFGMRGELLDQWNNKLFVDQSRQAWRIFDEYFTIEELTGLTRPR